MPLAAEKIITRNWGTSRLLDPRRPTRAPAATRRWRRRWACSRPQIIDEVKKSQPPRPRRRRLPHRHEVELRPQGQPQAQVPGGQRRRVRAGHVQGPLHPRERPAHDAGGHRHRRLRPRRAHGLHLRPRRVPVPGGAAPEGHRRGVRGPASSARRCWAGLRPRLLRRPRRGRVHLRRGDRRCSSPSRGRRAGPVSSLPSPRWWASSAARRW